MRDFHYSLVLAFLFSNVFTFSCSISEYANANQTNDIKTDEYKESKVEVVSRKDGELTTKDILQNRDLSLYKQGGHRGFNKDLTEKEHYVRDFIWNCWKEKSHCYIRESYLSLEGMTSTSHIFIELNETGKWRIIWRIVRTADWANGTPEVITDVPEITSVEWMENKPIKGERALVFKNSSGKILQSMPEFFIE